MTYNWEWWGIVGSGMAPILGFCVQFPPLANIILLYSECFVWSTDLKEG